MKVLIVDDDDRIRDLIARYLSENGYNTITSSNASFAMEVLLQDPEIAILILDVMMPGKLGTDLVKDLRASGFRTPVLMLSALSEAENRILGLESGADDYLTKPFEPKELLLRIARILERSAQIENLSKKSQIKFGKYIFSLSSLKLFKNKELFIITSTEANLLRILAENINNFVSREELANKCFGISERSVDVQIVRLRNKIEEDPKKPKYLITVRNSGYGLYTDVE